MPEERKLVTILFADVTDSTSLGDTLDPEDVRAIMTRYYDHAHHVVSLYGGTLEKFIGDAVMAVFGLPQAHGDDAERALAAALALREAVTKDTLLGETFLLRIGVNSGEVIAASDTSRNDFLVTGDAVNVAARLQQYANPGEIVVGERTVNATRPAFLFDEPQLIEIRGKRQPLRTFTLKAACTVCKAEHPPFIGRRSDLLQLSLLQTRALEEQRPQLISIVAPAGTGKTRLIEEFLNRLDPADHFQIATARCLPYGQTLTYWPLRGLLTGLLGGEISRPRIVETLTNSGYENEDAAHLADLILSTLGMEGERTTDRESIFTSWRLLIEAFARQGPHIIVFEDLHWASDSLLDLVEHIIHLRTQAALLLMTLSRQELLDRRPSWSGGRQNFTALALQPLTETQTYDLVERLAQNLPESTRKQIVERSGGNPFFALELLRGLSERLLTGISTPQDTIPDTVHAAILARFDLLAARERAVLQVASVASRGFRSTLLQAALETYSEQDIARALNGLLARDLIVQAEGDAFSFRHILIRDVAYGTLSRNERIRLHSKMALCLEAIAHNHQDEYIELLAYHYREAVLLSRQSTIHQASLVETERAIHFLKRAGELAGRSGAFTEARVHLQNAIELAPESEHLALYELLGDSFPWSKNAVDAYNTALEYWRSSGSENAQQGARLLRKLLMTYIRGGMARRLHLTDQDLLPVATEAQQLIEHTGDEDELWRLRVAGVFMCKRTNALSTFSLEDDTKMRETALAAATYFERKGNWIASSEARDAYTGISIAMGAFADAIEASKMRLTTPDLPAFERGDALNMMATTLASQGDYDGCIALIQEALADLRPGQPIVHLGHGIAQAIRAAYLSGRWSDSTRFLSILEEVKEQFQNDPDKIFGCMDGYYYALLVALAQENQAQVDLVVSTIKRVYGERWPSYAATFDALQADDRHKIDINLSVLEKGLIEVMLQFYTERGIVVPASFIRRADTHHWNSNMTDWIGKTASALATGDDNALAQAIDLAEAHHLIIHAARMRIVLAQHTGDSMQLERARPVLERLGDRQFLRRLEEVSASIHEDAFLVHSLRDGKDM